MNRFRFLFVVFLCVQSDISLAEQLFVISAEEPFFLNSKDIKDAVVSQREGKLTLLIECRERILRILDRDGALLYSERDVIASDYMLDGEHAIVYLQHTKDFVGFDFHGLLICKYTKEGVYARLLYPSSDRTPKEGTQFWISGLHSFSWPIVEAHIGIIDNRGLQNNLQGYWKARIDLSQSRKDGNSFFNE